MTMHPRYSTAALLGLSAVLLISFTAVPLTFTATPSD